MTTVPILGVSLRRIALTGCPIALTERAFPPLNESPSKGSAPDGSQLKVLTEGLSDSKKSWRWASDPLAEHFERHPHGALAALASDPGITLGFELGDSSVVWHAPSKRDQRALVNPLKVRLSNRCHASGCSRTRSADRYLESWSAFDTAPQITYNNSGLRTGGCGACFAAPDETLGMARSWAIVHSENASGSHH
jgi:hypothetical protein